MALWRSHQRWTDVTILWPVVKGECDRQKAETVFRVHMELDPAYCDMDQDERDRFVRELP